MKRHKKYALLEDDTIEPLYYPNGEPRHIDEEENCLILYRIKIYGARGYTSMTMGLKIIKEADTKEELEEFKEKKDESKIGR